MQTHNSCETFYVIMLQVRSLPNKACFKYHISKQLATDLLMATKTMTSDTSERNQMFLELQSVRTLM